MTAITPTRLTPEGFARYGTVVQRPQGPPLAADATFAFWSDVAHYHVAGETEIGLCTVYRQAGAPVTWMERHARTPELLIPLDAPFVLPVMTADAPDSGVEAFHVAVGEAVVIGQNVWHSACHPVAGEAATYFVIFRRGTPHEDVIKKPVAGVAIGAY
jgi:ureidoglycolate hydrolase